MPNIIQINRLTTCMPKFLRLIPSGIRGDTKAGKPVGVVVNRSEALKVLATNVDSVDVGGVRGGVGGGIEAEGIQSADATVISEIGISTMGLVEQGEGREDDVEYDSDIVSKP